MREDSHRGAPRSARAQGRAGSGRDTRAPRSGSPGQAPGGAKGGAKTSYAGGATAKASRPTPAASAGTARLTDVIEPVLKAMEIDLEAIRLTSAGRRALLRIVVDADGGLSLDDIADVSREVSAKLDASDVMGAAPYTLEVTSPGIDRPLTQPRHWRRATGRLVAAAPLDGKGQDPQQINHDGESLTYKGRVVGADQDHVTLDIDGARRTFSFSELGPGRVQVEFGRLDEIDELDGADDLDSFRDAEDSWQDEDIASGSGQADKEGSDGH